jgi:hypothetical protein
MFIDRPGNLTGMAAWVVLEAAAGFAAAVILPLIPLPLAERLFRIPLLPVTLALTGVAVVIFLASLRIVARQKQQTMASSFLPHARQAGWLIAIFAFWTVLLFLGINLLEYYDSLTADGKYVFWFGLAMVICAWCFFHLRGREAVPEGDVPLDVKHLKSLEQVIAPKKKQ